MQRHRFERPDAGFDVLTPRGERVRFDVDFDAARQLIVKLERRVLSAAASVDANDAH